MILSWRGVSSSRKKRIFRCEMNRELQAEYDFVILGSNFENSVLAG